VQLSLVDSLRCPAHPEESALVLSVESWAGSRVAEGMLGCPVCNARYPIRRATVHFSSTGSVRHEGTTEQVDVMRLAAQLGVTDPGGVVLLTGRYATTHAALTDMVEVTCVLVDAGASASMLAVNFVLDGRLPLVDGALRAAAVDVERAVLLPDVVRCTKPGGRIVAPDGSPIPPGVRLLARDDREWVGEAEGGATVQLRRSGRSPTA
jgi:uncharacterized protein YbaR (Trm112 family)